jgi:hypothetical protein
MMFMHDAPPPVAFAKTYSEAELKLNFLAVALGAAAAPIAVTKATSGPAVTSTSWKSKATGLVDQAKNVFHVAM